MCGMIYSWVEPKPFFIEFGNTYLHGDLLSEATDKPPDLLFLHGEHCQGSGAFLMLRQVLLEQHGLSSCAFDFIGYGKTGGNCLPLHLQERVAQTCDIIDACFDLQAFSIVAADLGAEVALCLPKSFPIRHLVVLNPPSGFTPTGDMPCHQVSSDDEVRQRLMFLNDNPAFLVKVADTVNTLLQYSR